MDYPSKEEEKLIVRHNISSKGFPKANTVVSVEEILKAKEAERPSYIIKKGLNSKGKSIFIMTRAPRSRDALAIIGPWSC